MGSRSFYDNPSQKKVVDALASKRTQIAIKNARRAGDAKAKVKVLITVLAIFKALANFS
jgi:hypothetical protein